MEKNYIVNVVTKSAAMAIKAASSALAKTTVAAPYKINSQIYTALAAADLPALTNINVADGFTRMVLVQVSAAGVVTFKQSDAVANVTGKIFPDFATYAPSLDVDRALVGYIVIKAAGAAFVGGTTLLDAGTVVVTYMDAFGLDGQ